MPDKVQGLKKRKQTVTEIEQEHYVRMAGKLPVVGMFDIAGEHARTLEQGRQLYCALEALALNPDISKLLRETDPQALGYARAALRTWSYGHKEYTTQK